MTIIIITLILLQIDFASRDCQVAFLESMKDSGQLNRADRADDIVNRYCSAIPNNERCVFFIYITTIYFKLITE